jgi:hypothetical protein
MYCYCGKEIKSITSNTVVWQRCAYNDKGKIIYAICMHGIVCIDENNDILNKIDILEDLKISVQNEIVGYEPCDREKDRIDALEKAIEILKEEIKQ